MFKRVLLCYDGSTGSRQALRRGAELSVLLRSEVFVLSIVPTGVSSATQMVSAAGYAWLADEEERYRAELEQSLAWLRERGVQATGYFCRGNAIDLIVQHSKRLSIELVVLGHYPQTPGTFWWSSSKKQTLSEQVGCCVLVSVDSTLGAPAAI